MSLCLVSYDIYCFAECQYSECHCAEGRVLFIVMLNDILFCVTMMSVIVLKIIMPSFLCYLMFCQISVSRVSLCECHNQGWVLFIVMLNDNMLCVAMLCVMIQSVIMPSFLCYLMFFQMLVF
jgi:hypothetical protein